MSALSTVAEETPTREFEPATHKSIDETGLSRNNLMKLLLKTMYVQGVRESIELTNKMRVHIGIVKELLEEATDQMLIEVSGSVGANLQSDYAYRLTDKGVAWASAAMAQCSYVGPAPVSLRDYLAQIDRQAIGKEPISREKLAASFSNIIVPETLERRLGPAVNSGRAMLLYGAPGNGKSTLAEAIGSVFANTIMIPYCVEVDGELIKVFDPIVHTPEDDWDDNQESPSALLRSKPDGEAPQFRDRRWVPCKRPTIIVGGELNLDMLGLRFDRDGNFYEAPLHMKGVGGVFVVDDLGRQLVEPTVLLNRWIVPMEKKIDYMTLNSGKAFALPFDNVLIFSTNLRPDDLMDPAFLRRIPFKVEVKYPTREQFKDVFDMLLPKFGEDHLPDDLLDFIIEKITVEYEQPLSFYQPKFILDQVDASSRYIGEPFSLDKELVYEAIQNLTAKAEEDSPSWATVANV